MSDLPPASADGTQPRRRWLDRFAVGLSFACAVHCLVLPVVAIGVPILAETGWLGSSAHVWMLLLAAPISLAALALSWRHHHNRAITTGIIVGLLLLSSGVALHEILGHGRIEVAVTLIGAMILLLTHIYNLRLHREHA
ncbi:MAG: MerC domain-containing protein [Pseudomonadaceae bacterium]|nr:MerC domain-containing protein [Pseudomonadaceae bacterium]